MMWSGRSSTVGISSGSTPLTSTPCRRSPFASIISLMTNGAAPATCGIARACATTSRYSSKSSPYLSTSTCALTPRTLVPELVLEAAVIEITASSAPTPSATPTTAITVMTEMVERFFERRYRLPISNA